MFLSNEKKTLVNKKQNSGNYKIDFDGSNLPSGILFLYIYFRQLFGYKTNDSFE